jgi:hypothetical protein
METAMSIIDTVRSFLAPSAPSTTFATITVNSAVDYAELPKGFFNVETASGKKSLGYNGSFLSWRVGSVVADGGKRIAAPENRADLPTVRLNFQRPQCDGVQHVAGCSVIDTDSLDGDSSVIWDGAKPQSGVNWI